VHDVLGLCRKRIEGIGQPPWSGFCTPGLSLAHSEPRPRLSFDPKGSLSVARGTPVTGGLRTYVGSTPASAALRRCPQIGEGDLELGPADRRPDVGGLVRKAAYGAREPRPPSARAPCDGLAAAIRQVYLPALDRRPSSADDARFPGPDRCHPRRSRVIDQVPRHIQQAHGIQRLAFAVSLAREPPRTTPTTPGTSASRRTIASTEGRGAQHVFNPSGHAPFVASNRRRSVSGRIPPRAGKRA
jgi:hypothetical protein